MGTRRGASAPPWRHAPQRPELGSDQVHVWRASLLPGPARLQTLLETVSAEEQKRAEALRREEDRRRFITAHGLLRSILGLYLEVPPGKVTIRRDPYGKPRLPEDAGDLRFNMSHSHELALIAVAMGREVGVDVERIRAALPMREIVGRFLPGPEADALLALPEERLIGAFFKAWTRHEAYVKGIGRGLLPTPARLDAATVPSDAHDAPLHAERWSVVNLRVGSGYAAALAVEGGGWELQCYRRREPRR